MRNKASLSVHIAIALSLILLSLTSVTAPATADATSFHFTVTADMRGYHTDFGNLLQAINDDPGPGVFHVSIGDIDNTIPENRAEINEKLGTAFT